MVASASLAQVVQGFHRHRLDLLELCETRRKESIGKQLANCGSLLFSGKPMRADRAAVETAYE